MRKACSRGMRIHIIMEERKPHTRKKHTSRACRSKCARARVLSKIVYYYTDLSLTVPGVTVYLFGEVLLNEKQSHTFLCVIRCLLNSGI